MIEFGQRQKTNALSDSLYSSALTRHASESVHSGNPLLPTQPETSNQFAQRFAESCPMHLPTPGSCPFGGICHSCPRRVQAKLTVSQPDDEYEQEADRVADQVMRMPETCSSCSEDEKLQTKPLAEQVTPLVQRQAEPEEEENETPIQLKTLDSSLVQRQEEDEEEPVQTKLAEGIQIQRQAEPEDEEEPIQTKRWGGQTPQIGSDLAAQIHSLQGGGQPLPQSMRGFFEPRLGHDFSDVRVHTDQRAFEVAQAVNAQAFTLGRDIVFGQNRYVPDSQAGQRLLAHELVHTVQQNHATRAPTASIQRTIGDGHDLKSPRFAGDPTLEACYDDEARLTKGAPQSDSVRSVQQALSDLNRGYDLGPTGVDGIYGDFTWNAVKQFKADEQLGWEWMGDVGPGTMSRLDELFPSGKPPNKLPPQWDCPNFVGIPELNEVISGNRVLQQGDSGEAVRQIQQVLMNLGYSLPQYGADGKFGDETKSAVSSFQSSENKSPAGVVDTGTLQALNGKCATPTSACGPLCGGKPMFCLVSKHGGTFGVCSVAKEEFNSGAPDFLINHIDNTIEFWTKKQGWAWYIEVIPDACLPDDVPNDDWDIGFIQTVESLQFDASYTLNWSAARAVPVPSRDANPESTTDPWFNPAGATSGPVKFGTRNPRLGDFPHVPFPLFLPIKQNDVTPCAAIHKIECTGKFLYWLVVQRKGYDELVFLLNRTINISQILERDLTKPPDSFDAWSGRVGTGAHSPSSLAGDKGPNDPKRGRPVANDFLRYLLPFPGLPCPVKLPNSSLEFGS